jgi:hypothetical protein
MRTHVAMAAPIPVDAAILVDVVPAGGAHVGPIRRGIAALVVGVVGIVGLLGGPAVAEPRVALRVDDPAFVWRAPDACPDAANVRARVEQRLGGAIDGHLARIEIDITRERAQYVARIDARAITVANDVRTLRSRKCDALADAVAVVLARLASEVRMSRSTGPARIASNAPEPRIAGTDATGTIAMAGTTTTVAAVSSGDDEIDGDMSAQRIVDDEPAPKRVRRWGFGLHVLALSGVGALPQINLGGELAALVRRADKFAALGVSRWVPQDAKLAPGAPGGVEVRLDTLTLRGGWGPSTLPLRAWLLGEVGRLQGTGVGVEDERTARARWIALGAGLGVGWPMSDHARLVGTFEIAVPLERPRFMLDQGSDLYRPGAAAARCAFGLEVGWP